MLQFKDNPKALMLALEQFLSDYYGDRQVRSERDLAELATWKIPDSLLIIKIPTGCYPQLLVNWHK